MTPSNVKFKRAQKYSPKVWIRIAVSEKGTSEPFFAAQKQAITESAYLIHCIKARLIPFINCYHTFSKVLFCPDLTISHYASSVTEFLEDQKTSLATREKIHRTVFKYVL